MLAFLPSFLLRDNDNDNNRMMTTATIVQW
jgi:hypothetical protein